jgi:hypothetical protein
MKFPTYATPTILGLFFSFMGMTFAMTGGMEAVYIIGGLLILTYAVTIAYVLRKKQKGEGERVAYLLMLPMFVVTGEMMLFQLGKSTITQLTPDSEAFISGCQSTESKFIKPPTSPVQSITYNWNTKIKPPFIQFQVNGTRITSIHYLNLPVDVIPGIDFVEVKTSYKGAKQGGSFLKYTSPGKYTEVDLATADVLVYYQISPEQELKKAATEQGLIRYELIITDKRTDEKLASKHYFVDAKKGRACGPALDDRTFILRAIGKQ